MSEQQPPEAEERTRVRVSPKQVAGIVVLVLLVVFAVQNTASTEIHFFGGEFDSPLWVWFLGLIVVGILIGFVLPYGRKKD